VRGPALQHRDGAHRSEVIQGAARTFAHDPPERSLFSHGPMEYVPDPARRLEPFPDGARLALHVIVNVETWECIRT
jgi:hypothetical protein